jgi:hypothetical protein
MSRTKSVRGFSVGLLASATAAISVEEEDLRPTSVCPPRRDGRILAWLLLEHETVEALSKAHLRSARSVVIVLAGPRLVVFIVVMGGRS